MTKKCLYGIALYAIASILITSCIFHLIAICIEPIFIFHLITSCTEPIRLYVGVLELLQHKGIFAIYEPYQRAMVYKISYDDNPLSEYIYQC